MSRETREVVLHLQRCVVSNCHTCLIAGKSDLIAGKPDGLSCDEVTPDEN